MRLTSNIAITVDVQMMCRLISTALLLACFLPSTLTSNVNLLETLMNRLTDSQDNVCSPSSCRHPYSDVPETFCNQVQSYMHCLSGVNERNRCPEQMTLDAMTLLRSLSLDLAVKFCAEKVRQAECYTLEYCSRRNHTSNFCSQSQSQLECVEQILANVHCTRELLERAQHVKETIGQVMKIRGCIQDQRTQKPTSSDNNLACPGKFDCIFPKLSSRISAFCEQAGDYVQCLDLIIQDDECSYTAIGNARLSKLTIEGAMAARRCSGKDELLPLTKVRTFLLVLSAYVLATEFFTHRGMQL
ncbi:uncharacterized protein LOC131956404 isoform X2 [Physella acuta]|uniref:uncharacterized protein LOC131956404 isoform X2 n=1 Tax=Physella acuta TaxID=109671 RepID=UPI0027DBF8B6|nr:uncharacterized protein LOC131956404 isoform X2 [Physella acuta]